MSGYSSIPTIYDPTAHARPEGATSTPHRVCELAPGLGLGTLDQAVPFQWRVSVCDPGVPYCPTAHTSFEVTPATEYKYS